MKCKFCYATFEDMKVLSQLSLKDACIILDKLKKAGLQKITFAGGEPLLYKWLTEVITYSKNIGFTTSIITNGSFLNQHKLEQWSEILDWIGISIDSLNNDTNIKIGRTHRNIIDYYDLIRIIKSYNYKIKINTVVNKFNQEESMQEFINWVNPMRWKIFDTLRVEGQNDTQFDEIKTINNGFNRFVERHKHSSMVVEDNAAMTGSYLLIDPQGRLFENSKGKHTYSKPLQDNAIESCLTEINLNRKTFIERGGLYNW